jgi:hypothetical protein
LEVEAELTDELAGELRLRDLIDRPNDLLGVPGHAHLATRVTGSEQAAQLRVAALVEPLVRPW